MEAITISRPYANAIFEIAQEENDLESWSKLLLKLSECVANSKIKSMITSPTVTDGQVINVFADIIGELSTNVQKFLALLAENNRLQLLTEIAVSFEQLREKIEHVMTVDVISARAAKGVAAIASIMKGIILFIFLQIIYRTLFSKFTYNKYVPCIL